MSECLVREKIEEVIARKIRPALAAHGGDLELLEVTADNIVKVRLSGACATCPGAQQTMNEVITTALREACPEIAGVEAVHEISDDLLQQALKILRKNKQ